MKGILPIAAGVLSLASAWTSPALAIDGLTANGAVATDYVFRGITQSAKRPAVQGGLDYSFGDSGFAAGTWVSSIDFGDNTNLEWDIFANYNFDLGPVGASMGVVGYVFPYSGIGGPYDFVEPNLGLEYDFGIFAWSARAFWAPSLPASYVTVRNGYHPDSEYFLTAGVSAPAMRPALSPAARRRCGTLPPRFRRDLDTVDRPLEHAPAAARVRDVAAEERDRVVQHAAMGVVL